MSYGFLGAISGASKAGVSYGEAVMKDAFDERREKRLEEAKKRMEEDRRKWERNEWDHRRQQGHQDRFGADADRVGEVGTIGLENAAKQEQFKAMTPLEADRSEETTAATGRGHFVRDEEQHRRRLAEIAERDRLAAGRASAGGSESGPKPAGATELNHLRGTLVTRFGGTLNENGSIFLPPGTQDRFEEAYGLAVELMEPSGDSGRAPLSLGRAVTLSMEVVSGHLSEEDARAQARELAQQESFGMFGGGRRREWEENKAQELMGQSREQTRGLLAGPAEAATPATPAGDQSGSAAPPDVSSGQDYARLLSQAQEAIDQGRNPRAVREMLLEMGVPEEMIPF